MNSNELEDDNQSVSLSCPFANGFKIGFHHFCTVNDAPPPSGATTVIRNKVCRRVGNVFKKVTEISVGGKLIVLEDTYEFVREPENGCYIQSTCSPALENDSKETKQSQAERLVESGSGRKNVVKNIVKGFARSLKQHSQQQKQTAEVNRALNYILRRNKFNNGLIVRLVKSEAIRQHFRTYLERGVHQWLNQSRSVDKDTIVETIDTYLGLFDSKCVQLKKTKRTKL